MALDSNGAYYPVSPDVSYPPNTRGTLRHGSGPPDDSLGNDGDAYSDDDSPGSFYSKAGGTWTLITGSGGTAEIIVGVVDDPNGTHTPADPTKPAFYFRDSAGNDAIQFWRWSVADQEWKEVIVT